MDNELGNINPSNDDELELDLDLSDDLEDPEEIKAKAKEIAENAKKVSEKNKQLFARAKKAEGFELVDGKWIKPNKPEQLKPETKPVPSQDISTLDAMALIKADVSEDEDIAKIKKWAEVNGQTVREALKDPVMVKYLSDKKEERETARATQTNSVRKSSPPTADALFEKARKGEIKEDDIDKLTQARMEAKIKAKS